ncbi:MAG TPA: YceD family protein [Casimicrobiaceae bacterium]|nr:YceD family protein [Casimicrobiaceae bacterium]
MFFLTFLTEPSIDGMILRFSPTAPTADFHRGSPAQGAYAMVSRFVGGSGTGSDTSKSRLGAFELARDRGIVEGTVDAHRLPRVEDLVAGGPARVDWRIAGTTDASGRPALSVALSGAVMLSCQRCLADFEWKVEQQTELLLARNEDELEALDAESGSEVVLAESPVDPLELVEDELVLALPFAPRHPDGACAAPANSEVTNRRA